MAKSKPEAAPPTIDPAAVEPVLFYTGGPIYGDAPARDLRGADLVRLARVAALRVSGGAPVAPAEPDELAALADWLVASGAFSRALPEIVAVEREDPTAPADQAEEND